MKKPLLFVLGLIIVATIACKKDKGDKKNPTPAEILVANPIWKIDTMGIDANNDGVIDSALPPAFALKDCSRDNTLSFKADSTGIFSEGALKCNESDPSTKNFEWYFKDSARVINLTGLDEDVMNGDVKVITLTSEKFVMAKTFPIFGGIVVALKK